MPGTSSSSMDVNLGSSKSSRGAPRASPAEERRLMEERLRSYTADNGNNLLPRLWDRAGTQYQTQQPTQHNGGQTSSWPNGA